MPLLLPAPCLLCCADVMPCSLPRCPHLPCHPAGEAEEGEGKETEGTGLGEGDTTGAKDISNEVLPCPGCWPLAAAAGQPALTSRPDCLLPAVCCHRASGLHAAAVDTRPTPERCCLPLLPAPSSRPLRSWRTRTSCWAPSRRARKSSSRRRASRPPRTSRSRSRVRGGSSMERSGLGSAVRWQPAAPPRRPAARCMPDMGAVAVQAWRWTMTLRGRWRTLPPTSSSRVGGCEGVGRGMGQLWHSVGLLHTYSSRCSSPLIPTLHHACRRRVRRGGGGGGAAGPADGRGGARG